MRTYIHLVLFMEMVTFVPNDVCSSRYYIDRDYGKIERIVYHSAKAAS